MNICHYWVNTAFVKKGKLMLRKPEIDVASKDSDSKVFKNYFCISTYFE